MHSSLVVTADGVPLGLGAIKFWTRKRFKGTDALKRKINPTRVPMEGRESVILENLQHATALVGTPERCIHIGDRESNIFELLLPRVGAENTVSLAHVRGSCRRR